jgi:hypothetical protein
MQLSKSRKARGVSCDSDRLSAIPISLDLPEEIRWLIDDLETCLFPQLKPLGPIATAQQIIARETPLGLYKGLGAVVSGIVPKMAIRFASFEGESLPYSSRLASLVNKDKTTDQLGLTCGRDVAYKQA